MSRNIKYLAVHCTATAKTATVSSIQNYWKNELGWKSPGYHFIIKADGEVVNLLDINSVSNGVKGFNSVSINVCYIGGIDENKKPKDTRTPAQKQSLLNVLRELRRQFPNATIQGHRDFPNVAKACPSFDAKTEYKSL
ncbi:N-acetylmuramoyl-L-alanine amidase [Chryseobacterium sp.]|uniref:N-acetylmuramoyl-L-alanine amidase n=1 Tax=Chryseobacterium sp. TaxID=1871047 RepID=UPI0028A10F9D|nr:N-acetylmuramoyl-L-alanine amidase [Chryseobacterium sp.]